MYSFSTGCVFTIVKKTPNPESIKVVIDINNGPYLIV